jgi:DNA-3-methyladenine glycosylase
MILPPSFYNRSALRVAQDLLGCFLVRASFAAVPTSPPALLLIRRGVMTPRQRGSRGEVLARKGEWIIKKYKIVETEAYNGPKDLASHASRGKTARNAVMFGRPGLIYVYFTYGLHYMLNIVTGPVGYPAAVLIRAIEPIEPVETHHGVSLPRLDGPARLTKVLRIDKSFNGRPVYVKKYGLWIEGRKTAIKPSEITRGKRIGVDYAGKYKDKLWRFYLKT